MSTRVALVVAVLLAAVVNVTRSLWVPDLFDPWITIALGVAIIGVAAAAEMSADELGLARASVPSGLRWGLGAIALMAVVLAVVVAVPATRSLLEDDRTRISFGELMWRATVVIPVATVLVEELFFRGVLLGLLQRLTTAGRALAVSAVIFGVWHVLPVWRGGGAGELGAGGGVGRSGAVAATFVATTFAGVGFGWLRQRSGSLLAPIGAHIGTNSVTLVAAWFANR